VLASFVSTTASGAKVNVFVTAGAGVGLPAAAPDAPVVGAPVVGAADGGAEAGVAVVQAPRRRASAVAPALWAARRDPSIGASAVEVIGRSQALRRSEHRQPQHVTGAISAGAMRSTQRRRGCRCEFR
jgi:hypothetical protein